MNSFSAVATFTEEAYVESKHRITNSEWKQSLLFVMFILYARNMCNNDLFELVMRSTVSAYMHLFVVSRGGSTFI